MKTFQSKLLLLFIIMTLLPVIALGSYSYLVSVNAAQENAGQGMQAALEQMGKNLDFQMQLYKKSMDFMVTSKEIRTILFQNSFDPSKVETMDAYFNLDNIMGSLFYKSEPVGPIAFYKNNQMVYAYNKVDDNVLKDLGKSDMYKTDMEHEGSIQLHTIQIVKSETGNKYDYYVFGRRLYDYNYQVKEANNAGVYLFVEEKSFSDIFRNANKSGAGTVMIANGSGSIYSHTDKQKIGGRLSDEGITNGVPSDLLTGSFTSSINGQKMIIGYYKLPQWDLQVVQMVPEAYFTGNIGLIAKSTILFSSLLFIILLLVSWMLARRFSEPVRTLVGAMKMMQSGNFDVRIEKQFDNEFNLLSQSFNFMAIRLKETVNRLLEEEKRRGEIELQMLQYQINPHFVNNTIGSVRMYALAEGADKIAEVLLVLGRLFQRTLGGSSRLVRIRTEILSLQDFIRIERMQYMTQLTVNYDIEEAYMDYLIPNLLLQPLVENAIFHGFNKSIQQPTLTISIQLEGEDLILSLRDNGVGMSKEKIEEIMNGGGDIGRRLNRIGIKNVDQRLKLYYGESYGVHLDSSIGIGTVAVIRLPARREKEVDPS